MVWSWYQVGRYQTSNIYLAKLLEVYNLIVEGRSDASVISISTNHDGSAGKAINRLGDFMDDATAQIEASIEAAL